MTRTRPSDKGIEAWARDSDYTEGPDGRWFDEHGNVCDAEHLSEMFDAAMEAAASDVTYSVLCNRFRDEAQVKAFCAERPGYRPFFDSVVGWRAEHIITGVHTVRLWGAEQPLSESGREAVLACMFDHLVARCARTIQYRGDLLHDALRLSAQFDGTTDLRFWWSARESGTSLAFDINRFDAQQRAFTGLWFMVDLTNDDRGTWSVTFTPLEG